MEVTAAVPVVDAGALVEAFAAMGLTVVSLAQAAAEYRATTIIAEPRDQVVAPGERLVVKANPQRGLETDLLLVPTQQGYHAYRLETPGTAKEKRRARRLRESPKNAGVTVPDEVEAAVGGELEGLDERLRRAREAREEPLAARRARMHETDAANLLAAMREETVYMEPREIPPDDEKVRALLREVRLRYTENVVLKALERAGTLQRSGARMQVIREQGRVRLRIPISR